MQAYEDPLFTDRWCRNVGQCGRQVHVQQLHGESALDDALA
jgi:hypothetical protein